MIKLSRPRLPHSAPRSGIRRSHGVHTSLLSAPRAQFVPSDSFGGRSPERVAADALRTLFTFAAAKIIMAQLEGSGRGGLAAYNKKDYDDLAAALATFNDAGGSEEGEEERRSDSGGLASSSPSSSSASPPRKPSAGGKGDLWLSRLSRKNPSLSLRVMEVRKAYAERDFEWDSCKRLATEGLLESNLGILKERLRSAYDAGDSSADEEDEGKL